MIVTFGAALQRVVFGRRQEFALGPNGVHDDCVTPADYYCRHDEYRGRHYAYVQFPLPRRHLDPTLSATYDKNGYKAFCVLNTPTGTLLGTLLGNVHRHELWSPRFLQ